MKAAILQRIKYLKSYEVMRVLPYPGEILVRAGDTVSAFDHLGVAKVSFLSQTLSYSGKLIVKVGDWVLGGATLSRSGLFTKKTSQITPFTGSVNSVDPGKHTILIESPKRDFFLVSGFSGVVSSVDNVSKSVKVATPGIILRGVAGLSSGSGELVAASDLDGESSTGRVVFADFLDSTLLSKCKTLGVSGIIAGGTDWETYLVARTIPNFGLALIGGFGRLPVLSDILKVITEHLGKFVVIDGPRGTVFIPTSTLPNPASKIYDLTAELKSGDRVKVYAWPHFGEEGTVVELLNLEFKFDSGVVASAVRVKFSGGEEMTVPVESVGILV